MRIRIQSVFPILIMAVFLMPHSASARDAIIRVSQKASEKPPCGISHFKEKFLDSPFECRNLEESIPEEQACFEYLSKEIPLTLGYALAQCGIIDELEPLYKSILEKPDGGEFSSKRYIMAAMLYDQDTLCRMARMNYEENIQEQEENLDAWRYAARALLLCGDYIKSEQILKHILETDPGFLRGVNNLSAHFLDTADFEQASDYAQDYLAGDKYWPGIYYILSQIAYYTEDTMDNAWEYLDLGHQAAAQNLKYRDSFLEGRYYIFEGEPDKAAEAFSVELSTRFTWETYHFRRLHHDFIRYYLDLYDRDAIPDQEELRDQAQTLFDDEEYYNAAMRYAFLMMLSPLDPEYYFKLARCLEETGDSYDALRHYFLYLYFDPRGEWGDADHAREYLNTQVSE